MLITAGVYALASLATFVLLRERAVPRRAARRARAARLARAPGAHRARGARATATSCWLLACGACYQAGVAVVIALAAIYAEQVMGFKQTRDRWCSILVVNIAAAVGAFAFGYCAGPHRPQARRWPSRWSAGS